MTKNGTSKAQVIIAIISGIVAVILAVISTMATIYTKDSSLKESITKIETLDKKAQEILTIVEQKLPIGSIFPYAGNFNLSGLDKLEKAGWLPCTGALIPKDKYPTLFKVIGTTFGDSDQLGWFRLPDISGRVIMGAGEGHNLSKRIFGEVLGKETHAITISELPDHSHPYKDHRYYDPPERGKSGWDKDAATPTGDDNGGLINENRTTLSNENLRGRKFSIIQPSIVLNYIIKFK